MRVDPTSIHPLNLRPVKGLQNNSAENLPSEYKAALVRLSEIEGSGLNNSWRHIAGLESEIVSTLAEYPLESRNVVLGISGGTDSAVTALLFQKAGWNVHGFTLPINQNPAETDRARRFASQYGIQLEEVDLTPAYEAMLATEAYGPAKASKIRCGNLRARLRMMFLYDRAHALNGLVGSTDNLSEWAAGFWTLHGDVGNVSPIQALTKSYEVPALGLYLGLAPEYALAIPTDGLGISTSDEEQFGFSYLELDIIVCSTILGGLRNNIPTISDDRKDAIIRKIRSTDFKRRDPFAVDINNRLSTFLTNTDGW
jgi:nicotinamide-nucleotide amidase